MADGMMGILSDLTILLLAGAAGGFLYGLVHPEPHTFLVPFRKDPIRIDILGDIFAGCCASVGVFIILGFLPDLKWDEVPDDTGETLKVLALGILTGFSGLSLTRHLSTSLASRIEQITGEVKELKERGRVQELYDAAIFSYNEKQYGDALDSLQKIREIDPNNISVLFISAKALKRIGRFKEAVEVLNRVIHLSPDNHRALYNRACYRCLALDDENAVLQDLTNAMRLNSMYSNIAKNDPDLDRVRDTDQFKAAIR